MISKDYFYFKYPLTYRLGFPLIFCLINFFFNGSLGFKRVKISFDSINRSEYCFCNYKIAVLRIVK